MKSELIALLRSLRPIHGAVGSRDVDVTRQQAEIDAAIGILESLDGSVAQSDVRIIDKDEIRNVLDDLHAGEVSPNALATLQGWLDDPRPTAVEPSKQMPAATARALDSAVSAIYFDDSSDYLKALWSVVNHLDPRIHLLLQSDPTDAFEQAQAILESAPEGQIDYPAELAHLVSKNDGLIANERTLFAKVEAARDDQSRYEYLVDCEYQAAKKYLPKLVESEFKKKLRKRHDAARQLLI